jgi:VWFA-related protein
MTRVRSVVLSAVVILATPLLPVRAAQQPVFRAGVPTVSIYATVVDSTGRLIPNLGQDEFEVFDNGIRQDITVFANEVQPITLVMMLDRSQSMEQNFTLVRDAAEHFVTNLLPQDRVRLGSFSDRIQIDPPAFTGDKEELVRILRNNLQPAGGTPLWNATAVAMTALGREEGRRVVLLFTDGYDTPDFTTRDTNVSLARVRERAVEEGIMVYAIGLATPCEAPRLRIDTTARQAQASAQRGRGGIRLPRLPIPMPGPRIPTRVPPIPGGSGPFGLPPRTGERDQPSERSTGACVESKPDPDLKTLTLDGGGGYFELRGTDDLTATFARIADELHHQYLLAYTVPALDGKMHHVEVRAKQKNLTVRARKNYVASGK